MKKLFLTLIRQHKEILFGAFSGIITKSANQMKWSEMWEQLQSRAPPPRFRRACIFHDVK